MKIPIILQIYFIQQQKQVLESITLVNGDDINIESCFGCFCHHENDDITVYQCL